MSLLPRHSVEARDPLWLPTGALPFQKPQLAADPPKGADWTHEPLLDGRRLLVRVQRGEVRIQDRQGRHCGDRFADLVAHAADLPDCVLDGEICALDARGQPAHAELHRALARGRTASLVFYAFDCLWAAGEDCRPMRLDVRRAMLAHLLDHAPTLRIRALPGLPSAEAVVAATPNPARLKGVVSKRRDSSYVGGRGGDWIMWQPRLAQAFVAIGWIPAPREGPLRLLAAVREGERLVFAGWVDHGQALQAPEDLLPELSALATPAAPCAPHPALPGGREIRWLRPELVMNVEAAGRDGRGLLVQAAFRGFRDDKAPSEITWERPPEPA